MKLNIKQIVLFIVIFFIAAFFRLIKINWDSSTHIHPDERFLTMVGTAMKRPSLADYFNPAVSSFNPPNFGFGFFVYGIFPLTINTLITETFNANNYGDYNLWGRAFSAVMDLGSLVFLFLITVRLLRIYPSLPRQLPLIAMLFYGLAVMPIQLSHFFTTDPFLTCFLMGSVYGSLSYLTTKLFRWVCWSAVFWGMAFSSKVTALFFLPLIIVIFGWRLLTDLIGKNKGYWKREGARWLGACIIFGILGYLTIRICDPYIFETPYIYDFRINQSFWSSLKSLKALEGGNTTFPPAIQWISKPPIWYSLFNIAVFGLGIPHFMFLLIGFSFLFYVVLRYRKYILLLYIAIFTLIYFIYQSTTFVKIMRYFYFLYPFFCIFAAYGFLNIWNKIRRFRTYAGIALLVSLFIWPLMFLSIYLHPMSRVTASKWMYENLPDKSVIGVEHWDDGLPLGGIPNNNKEFKYEEVKVFGDDTDSKWEEINKAFSKIDYYVLSSNRAWGSMPTIPDRYPRTTQFYQDLFENKTQFKLVAEFYSYPSLEYLGIPLTLQDQWSDESFTVYDHPMVLIYKKVGY